MLLSRKASRVGDSNAWTMEEESIPRGENGQKELRRWRSKGRDRRAKGQKVYIGKSKVVGGGFFI